MYDTKNESREAVIDRLPVKAERAPDSHGGESSGFKVAASRPQGLNQNVVLTKKNARGMLPGRSVLLVFTGMTQVSPGYRRLDHHPGHHGRRAAAAACGCYQRGRRNHRDEEHFPRLRRLERHRHG